MTTWVLIIYIYAGVWAKGDSVTLTTVTGFTTQDTCEVAAKNVMDLTENSTKITRTKCVEVK